MVRLLPALVLVAACTGPREAPRSFDALCVYVFEHFDDRRPDALAGGLDNLELWLDDHPEEPQDGYTIDPLDEEQVDTFGEEHTAEGIAGAAVLSESPYPPEALAGPLLVDDQTVVFPGLYARFDREMDAEEAACWVDQACDWTEVYNDIEAELPLGITQRTLSWEQWRWVETSSGSALLHRSWMEEPAEVSASWLHMDEQFYMGVVVPRDDGAWRVQVGWVVAEIAGGLVPQSTALRLAVDGFRDKDELLYAYVEENGR